MKKKKRPKASIASTASAPAGSAQTAAATPAETDSKPNLSTAAFRDFVAKRKAGRKGAQADPKPVPPRAPPMRPTDERLSKEDRPRKTQAGFYRAPAPIERLRDQGKLDPLPHINQAMFQAAGKLYDHFYQGGLGGIRAQDVSRAVGAGDGGSCQYPQTEKAMFHRQKFRESTRIMGWHEAAPFRGAGRLVVDVVCFGVGVQQASRIHILGGRNETVLAAGMDRLCEGLYALASHWKLF